MSIWQFVDSISSAPTVRLDLHSAAGGLMLAGEPELSPPVMRRVTAASMLADGEQIPAAAFGNRVIKMTLQLVHHSTTDLAAAKLQALARELTRQPGNILRVMIGSTPMFFRTYPAPDAAYRLLLDAPQWGSATLDIPCEPFGYGTKETLPAATVFNDPAEATTLNANPFFEANVASWTPSGGSFVRSTAQFFDGAASGLLTPSGVNTTAAVRSELVPIAGGAGAGVRASGRIRCATGRSVSLLIDWHTAGGAYISTSTQTLTVTANTWTSYDFTVAAPATTAQAQMGASMTGTPPATDLLYVDAMRIRVPGTVGGMTLDIHNPKGDVETPLYLTVSGGVGSPGRMRSALAMRRRGTPANMPLYMSAESMTQGTDTTVQAGNPAFSGQGSNFSKTTFATNAGMLSRIYTPARFPATASTDARGTYRIYVRLRQNIASNFDEYDLRLVWGGPTAVAQVANDTVKLPYDNGLNGATFKYIYLGLVQIPMGRDPITDGPSGADLATEGVYMYVQAQRVDGTGSIDWDHIVALPADDRLQLVKWPTNQFFEGDTFVLEGGSTPGAYSLNTAGQLTSNEAIEIVGSGMMITPGRTNRLVFARDVGVSTGDAGGGDVITATTVLTPHYFPRYVFPIRPVST